MSTDLTGATRRILRLRQASSVSETEWELSCEEFRRAVSGTSSTEQLKALLDRDADELLLPPYLKNAVYERLLVLDGRSPATLREYAWHLQLYGPDRDEEAETLLAEAERVDRG
jgi:hypothetical protein